MAKQIYFHVDAGSMPISFYGESTSMSYNETCELLSEKADTIHTTDMAHFSFDLIDMGYEIYLCYKDKKVKIEPDMTIEPIGKHLKRGHNIRKLFIGHAFDDMLGIEYKEHSIGPNEQHNNQAYFKVGDFICHKYYSIYGRCRKICDITDDAYLCTIPGDIGGTSSVLFNEQGNWRLWTIQDAKDGDVITNGKLIVIFNKLEEPAYKQHIIAYVGLDLCGKLQITEDTWWLGVDKARPATKEQRDLLFKKMKEAGYEWDGEKKELRKIQPHYDISYLMPKQWVLVRDCDNQVWGLSMFSHRDMGCYICLNREDFTQCIPFDGNEHLLGTTDPCGKEFINW